VKNPAICDEENLRACAAALVGVRIESGSFEGVVDRGLPDDLVYFDPPYVPVSATSDFNSYTADGFGWAEQVRLRDVALCLAGRGVHVVCRCCGILETFRSYGAEGLEMARRRHATCVAALSVGERKESA
jgi:DNA adenine methylase